MLTLAHVWGALNGADGPCLGSYWGIWRTNRARKGQPWGTYRAPNPELRLAIVVRHQLKRRRKELRFSQESLANEIRCDRKTVGRWERGLSDVSAEYREPLANALQWSSEQLDRALGGGHDLPQASQGWWSNFVTLEQSATAVRQYGAILVPGLLQTRAYASALLGDDDLVGQRLDRQRMVTRPHNAIELTTVVDESVLLRPIGGTTVLAEQVRFLLMMAERPNVTIQVLPLDAATQPAPWGSMVMLDFPWPGGLVYFEHQDGSYTLDKAHDIMAHLETFDRLTQLALPPTESVATMATRAKELENERATELA